VRAAVLTEFNAPYGLAAIERGEVIRSVVVT
jgi:hypothetical protein